MENSTRSVPNPAPSRWNGRVLLDAAAEIILNITTFVLRFVWWCFRWSFATVIILGVMGAAGWFVFLRAVERGDLVAIPNIVDMPLSEAYRLLLEQGLQVGEPDEMFDEDRPRNYVVAQRPPAGQVVPQGRRIFPTISVGPDAERAPKLIGMMLQDAQDEVTRRGRFSIRMPVARMPHKTPRDHIVGQDPPPDKPVPRGSEISLLVSNGDASQSFVLQQLVGMNLSDATRELERLNLRPVVVTSDNQDHPFDVVFAQEPEQGTLVTQGVQVKIWVRTTAVVESAWREVRVSYTMPPASQPREVRFDVINKEGATITVFPRSIDYDTSGRPPRFEPGRVINIPLSFQDQVTVVVYLDGRRTRTYYYQGDADPVITNYDIN